MPFVPGTPEALEASLQRRDSKDFSSTCRGINQNGTPCRTKISGKVTALKTTIDGKEAYFCWRHKEQAAALIQKKSKQWDAGGASTGGAGGSGAGLGKRRGSMDVLVEKVVAMAVTDDVKPGTTVATTSTVTATTTVNMPNTTPPLHFTARLKNIITGSGPPPPTPTPPPIATPPPASSSKSAKLREFLFALFEKPKKRDPNLFPDEDSDDDVADNTPPAYPSPQPADSPPQLGFLESCIKKASSKVRFETTPQGPPMPHMSPPGPAPQQQPSALSPPRKPKSQTPGYMSRRKVESLVKESKTAIIPPYLTAATRKVMHEALSKPFSNSDTPGYIYIFALLPSSPNRPTMPTASTIDPNDPTSQNAPRVLLKIGRTVNVASRLNQHANQCNYEPTLIRYYPHTDSKSVASKTAVVHKVPNVNRIERLIHLELRDDPKIYPDELRHKCTVCRKIHKEWFSIEATEEGVKWVDSVISRWITWGEYWGGEGEGAKRTRAEEEAALRRGERIAAAADDESEEDDDEEEEIVITSKVKTKTPPRQRKSRASRGGGGLGVDEDEDSGRGSPVRSPRRTPKAKATETDRPTALKRGDGHRSVDRAKTKSPSTPRTPRKKSPTDTPTATPRKSLAGARSTPKKKTKTTLTVEVTDDDDDYDEDSDASYHDAETGEDEDDLDDDDGEGEEWVEGGKVETKSPNWKKGVRGAVGKGKVKVGRK